MLPNVSDMERGRLRMSVGYGTHKKNRLLSPIEVGLLLERAHKGGASLEDCAKESGLDGTGHIGRFLRILKLPQDIQHLVGWGSPKGGIGFSAAVELVKLQDDNDQRVVAEAILSNNLKSREIRQVAQLRTRSGKSIDECLKEILEMRPKIDKRYVFIGSVEDRDIQITLGEKTQGERDLILKSGIEHLKLRNASGRLGKQFFTLVGDEAFHVAMNKIGKDVIEELFRNYLSETLENTRSPG